MLAPSWQGGRRRGCSFSTALPQVLSYPHSGSSKGGWEEKCLLHLPGGTSQPSQRASFADGPCAELSNPAVWKHRFPVGKPPACRMRQGGGDKRVHPQQHTA